MIVRRRWAERRRREIIRDLYALRREVRPDEARVVDDMIMYAAVGRDRLRLPDDYVEDVRRTLREHAHVMALFEESRAVRAGAGFTVSDRVINTETGEEVDVTYRSTRER